MSGDEILWQDPAAGLRLVLARAASPEVVALLSATVWGGGGLRYRLLDMPEKLSRLRDPRFATLERRGAVESVFVLDRAVKRIAGRPVAAVHFAMAVTAPGRRRQGLAERTARLLRGWCERTLGRPALAFAYVEAGTRITLRISDQVGHALQAELRLAPFSRLRPRADPRAAPASAADLRAVRDWLAALYPGHAFVDPDWGLRPGSVWVLRAGDRLVAAVAAEPMRWRIEALPGLAGRLLLALLRLAPRRLRPLDPDDLRAIRFSALCAEPGREAALATLMEAVLASAGARVGLVLADPRSPVPARFLAAARLGALSRAVRDSVLLRADFAGLDPPALEALRAQPVYISPADVF